MALNGLYYDIKWSVQQPIVNVLLHFAQLIYNRVSI